jgi:hypothetical protein
MEMKARQIAPALSSVYALGMIDQLRCIERGEDGFWGKWQSTGANAAHVVHGGDIVARIDLDGRVSALQRSPGRPWFTWDLRAVELAATRLPDGPPVLFAADAERRAWQTWKPAPHAPWSPWEPLDGPVEGISAGVIPGGGLVLCGLRDGTVWHRWQNRVFAEWEPWTALGGPPGGATAVSLTTITGGGLALFAVGGDGGLHHRWQDKPFGPWGDWESLGAPVASVSITHAPGGGLALFAIGADHGVLYRVQRKPFGAWSGWSALGFRAKRIAAQPSFTDGLEVFAIGLDDEVCHAWCNRLDAPWSAWIVLEHEQSAYRAADGPP